VFQQGVEERAVDDHHRPVVAFVVEEPGEFEERGFKLEVPVQSLARNPERVVGKLGWFVVPHAVVGMIGTPNPPMSRKI